MTARLQHPDPVVERLARVAHVLEAVARVDEVEAPVRDAGKDLRVAVGQVPARQLRMPGNISR